MPPGFIPRMETYLGRNTVLVGSRGMGCQYESLNDAIKFCEDHFDCADNPTVLVASGVQYDEDVLCRKDCIHLNALMPGGAVSVKSLTFSDCTEASIALFNASGDHTLLVRDPALGADYPKSNSVHGIRFNRSVNNPVWVGDAINSVRFLGSYTDASDFGTGTLGLLRCFLEQAAGCASGYGGLYACMCDNIGMHQGIGGGGVKCRQVNQQFIFQSNIIGMFEVSADLTTPGIFFPFDKRNDGPVMMDGFAYGFLLTDLDSRVGPSGGGAFGFSRGMDCFLFVSNGPQNATPSILSGVTIREVLQILTGDVQFFDSFFAGRGAATFSVGVGGSGAICRWDGGRYMMLPTVDAGPPASQFIETVGYGS